MSTHQTGSRISFDSGNAARRSTRPPVFKSPVWAKAAFLATQRLRRSGSLPLLDQIKDTPFWAPERVLEYQFARLKSLLEHAEAHVPYYRELFKSIGMTARDIRSFDDFSRIPVLTKETVRERLSDLVREDVPPQSFIKHHSGGSTGIPLTFYRDRLYLDASDAGVFRNLSQSGWRPGELIAFFWGWDETLYRMPRWKFELRQRARRTYQFDPFNSGPEQMSRWAERWRSLRPTVALGYASTIARFAAHVESTGVNVRPLRGVFTTAEKLYPHQRWLISRVFQCKVYDCYGSSEIQNIAVECAAGNMHINADFAVVELENGSASSEASMPLILTSLWNYSMPFIRYRNEDWGELVDGRCSCGNNFPLMSLNISRLSDNILLPGGRVVHGEFFTHLMYGIEGVQSFQFHQTAADTIVIRFVALKEGTALRTQRIEHMLEKIRALSPEPLNIIVQQVDEIPLSSAGKHRFTLSDVISSASGQG
ncbi:MAG TPA: hypothetical protein VN345_06905 [Blastocatellia bacterium]|nr:hypothetical protein [Blastocatellia bacterium]